MNPYDYPGASFGADPPPTIDTSARLTGFWLTARLLTPQWVKESATIAMGVFGGMALFRMFGKRVPQNPPRLGL